jgi:hypothetical protein
MAGRFGKYGEVKIRERLRRTRMGTCICGAFPVGRRCPRGRRGKRESVPKKR